MGMDKAGNRFTAYSPEVPYDLAAGAHVNLQDQTPHGYRYQKSYLCFAGTPFREVPYLLRQQLEENLRLIVGWTADFLTREGQRVQLG
jgi:hypothetical protein